MGKEVFKSIENYPNYEVSNYGRVKSLKFGKERILKPRDSKGGYLVVALYKNGKRKTFKVHQLVAICFLNHKPDGTQKTVVDHVDNNKLNNHINNLQLTTNRHNSSKDRKGGSSKYVGVCWHKPTNKWLSQIRINGKLKHLGLFTCELAASNVYQKELNKL